MSTEADKQRYSLTAVFRSRAARLLTIVFLVQATAFYATSRSEDSPHIRPLSEFPFEIGKWRVVQEGYVDEETQKVLRADDTLSRTYAGPGQAGAHLFIAFFQSQRTGQTPHSPKNCLPGSGWEATETGSVGIPVKGHQGPIEVNRYVVSKGAARSVVLYWYQSRDRTIASEYEAKMWLVADAIRYNRSDTALIRVIVPVQGNNDDEATQVAADFVQAVYPTLRQRLPS